MLEIIEAIQQYTQGLTRDGLCRQQIVQDAVIRRFEILGEAARNVPSDMRQNHPEVPWHQIANMRNYLIHGYHVVDLDVTWDTVQNDLPVLEQQLRQLLNQTP
jgi:uncharacterized protein with HEPN domain